MKKKVTIFCDSIISCAQLKHEQKCINILKKNKNFKITHKQIIGGTTRVALEKLEKFILRKKNDLIVLQFGINDSWHFKSLKGLANVSIQSFECNLQEIILKCKKFETKHIFLLNYHKLLKYRKETNNKTVNQNLEMYNKIINKISKKNSNVTLVDLSKHTSRFSAKFICLPEPDGVHLSSNGSKIYAKLILKYLLKKI